MNTENTLVQDQIYWYVSCFPVRVYSNMDKCMKSLERFKTEMTSSSMPDYIRAYVGGLDNAGWERFYFLMLEPMQILKGNESWLLHCLKWVLKENNLSDLTESVFFQLHTDPEGDAPGISPVWWDIMCERYLDDLLYSLGTFCD